jgi:maltooligosyltrehalose trehalohydrolase
LIGLTSGHLDALTTKARQDRLRISSPGVHFFANYYPNLTGAPLAIREPSFIPSLSVRRRSVVTLRVAGGEMVRVWAPSAKQVALVLKHDRLEMQRDQNGWWASRIELPDSTDYQFFVDGEVRPDPRSPWQPQGVHGLSRHVDHSRFKWADDNWQPPPLERAIIYELHVGTFTAAGTFLGVLDRLDHLLALGVTHVELMPIAEFPGEYGWGYDGVYPYAPHHAYGGPAGLKKMVDECHRRGLAVLLDVVYNHLGPSGNYLPHFGPYFTDRYQTPWGSAINFDGPDSDEVRRYLIDNALMWLRDYHFDGLRLDAVHAIIDHSAIHFLEQLASEVRALERDLGRDFVLIAESDLNDPRIVRPERLGGFGLDAQWSDDVHHALHAVLTGEKQGYYEDFGSLADLASALTSPYVYAGRYSRHRRRRHGKSAREIPASRFVVYLQDHDQIGNRAAGERISHLVNHNRAKIGAALIVLSPYVPMIFQGEEWASSSPFQYFVDFQSEPELASNVAAGRRREFAAFGWNPAEVPDPTARSAFLRSEIQWNELAQPEHAEMLRWYRSLIALRRELLGDNRASTSPPRVTYDESRGWLKLTRDSLLIACNFSPSSCELAWDGPPRENLLCSSPEISVKTAALVLPPESVAIFGPAKEHK